MFRNSVLLYLLGLCLGLSSCDANRVFDEYTSVSGKWHKDQIISFKVNAPDSINNYNLFVNLRNTNAYKYNNLFLIMEMVYPNGKTIKDTLEYEMAKPNGELLGTGFADVKENKLEYNLTQEPSEG